VTLEGKVALIVGGGRGIGRAAVLALAREGAKVVVVDPGAAPDGTGEDAAVADTVAHEARVIGAETAASALAVTGEESAAAAVALAVERFGKLDVVVHAAAVSREAVALHVERADLDAVLDAHVRAPFALVRAAGRVMVDSGAGGAIVLCSSPAAFFGAARQSLHAAGAAAVVGLVRSTAAELRRHDVRVNAVAPTARTRLTEALPTFQGVREGSLSAEHVGAVIAYLASDLSRELTGEVLGVAGSRVYSLRTRETAGAFSEDGGPFALDKLHAAIRDVLKPG